MVDTEALLQRYKKEIDDLRRRLAEREKEAAEPRKGRRLSEREVIAQWELPKAIRAKFICSCAPATGRIKSDERSQFPHSATDEAYFDKPDGRR